MSVEIPNPEDLSPEEFAKNMPVPGAGVGTGDTGIPQGYVPPPRFEIRTPTTFTDPEARGMMTTKKVSVPGVVSGRNVQQPFYQPTREATTILAGMDDVTRLRLQQQMYAAGWYGSSTPQFVTAARKGVGYLGLSDADKGAFSDLLLTANLQGVTWDVLLNSQSKVTRSQLGGGGGVGRPRPSSEDLTEIIQRTAVETIGRKLDDDTAKQLVSSYQSRAMSTSSEQAPSADVFFQNRIEQKYGAESEAYKYLNAISNVAVLLGGA